MAGDTTESPASSPGEDSRGCAKKPLFRLETVPDVKAPYRASSRTASRPCWSHSAATAERDRSTWTRETARKEPNRSTFPRPCTLSDKIYCTTFWNGEGASFWTAVRMEGMAVGGVRMWTVAGGRVGTDPRCLSIGTTPLAWG